MASELALQRRPIVAVSGRPTRLFYRRKLRCQTGGGTRALAWESVLNVAISPLESIRDSE
jgi:hypothetical protein